MSKVKYNSIGNLKKLEERNNDTGADFHARVFTSWYRFVSMLFDNLPVKILFEVSRQD